jgi:hypothetical protein
LGQRRKPRTLSVEKSCVVAEVVVCRKFVVWGKARDKFIYCVRGGGATVRA